MTTPDTEGGDGPQHRSSVHIKLEHQGNLRMIQHGLRTIQTLHTSQSRNYDITGTSQVSALSNDSYGRVLGCTFSLLLKACTEAADCFCHKVFSQ